MEKLKAVATMLKARAMPEQVDAEITEASSLSSFSEAEGGLLAARLEYTGEVQLWSAGGELTDLVAALTAWLDANAGRHDRFDGLTGAPVGKGRSDVVLTFRFSEEITYVEDAAYTGVDRLEWGGRVWKRAAPAPGVIQGDEVAVTPQPE
ncbi:MAG: phage tail protein [Deltaproteobacteria bacterium]|nr:phage tail protein [Deltaproteobacteria bacterium]